MRLRNRLILYLTVFSAIMVYIFGPFRSINPELKPYVNEYITMATRYCKPLDLNLPPRIDIDFSERMGEDILGYCAHYKRATFFIRIRESYWRKASDDVKYQLIMHELTHCILEEGHSSIGDSYMFYAINFLSKSTVQQQMNDLFRMKCDNNIYEPRRLFDSSLPSRQSPGML